MICHKNLAFRVINLKIKNLKLIFLSAYTIHLLNLMVPSNLYPVRVGSVGKFEHKLLSGVTEKHGKKLVVMARCIPKIEAIKIY